MSSRKTSFFFILARTPLGLLFESVLTLPEGAVKRLELELVSLLEVAEAMFVLELVEGILLLLSELLFLFFLGLLLLVLDLLGELWLIKMGIGSCSSSCD